MAESRNAHILTPKCYENDMDRAKLAWRRRELLAREAAGQLRPAEQRHPAYKVRLTVNIAVFIVCLPTGCCIDSHDFS